MSERRKFRVRVATADYVIVERNVDAVDEADAIEAAKIIVGYEGGYSHRELIVTILGGAA